MNPTEEDPENGKAEVLKLRQAGERLVAEEPTRRGQPRRIDWKLYNRMVDAYVEKRSAEHVAAVCGLAPEVAEKYVERGCRRRGLPPLRQGVEDARKFVKTEKLRKELDRLRRRREDVRVLIFGMERALLDLGRGVFREQRGEGVTLESRHRLILEEAGLTRRIETIEAKVGETRVTLEDPCLRLVIEEQFADTFRTGQMGMMLSILNKLSVEERMKVVDQFDVPESRIYCRAVAIVAARNSEEDRPNQEKPLDRRS